jgi:X-domain of DnaJ-containing
VGYVYRIKATTHPLRSGASWGSAINARLTSWGSTYNTFSTVLSTVRKAYTVKSAFAALQTAESNPDTTPEQKQLLEEKAAKVAIEALWSGVRLEIYDVLKEVCDIVLDANTITKIHCVDRINALERLGMEFEAAKADIISEEFVTVEHQAKD